MENGRFEASIVRRMKTAFTRSRINIIQQEHGSRSSHPTRSRLHRRDSEHQATLNLCRHERAAAAASAVVLSGGSQPIPALHRRWRIATCRSRARSRDHLARRGANFIRERAWFTAPQRQLAEHHQLQPHLALSSCFVKARLSNPLRCRELPLGLLQSVSALCWQRLLG